jgi:hypothetical protein
MRAAVSATSKNIITPIPYNGGAVVGHLEAPFVVMIYGLLMC